MKIKMYLRRLLFKIQGSRALIALSHLVEIWPNVHVISQSSIFKSHKIKYLIMVQLHVAIIDYLNTERKEKSKK